MTRPRLLDLYCGVGGCAMGYHRAGFEVVGVDIVRQWEYPFEFHLGDALTFPLEGFDVIHASPPCKNFTPLRTTWQRTARLFDPHPELLAPTLARLEAHGAPWVIENVPGAAPILPGAVTLCGSAFALRVRRHRLFASSLALPAPPPCDHAGQGRPLGVYGHGGAWDRSKHPGGGGIKVSRADAAEVLGIDWSIDQSRLSQAIPPAYTEWVGRQLLKAVAA